LDCYHAALVDAGVRGYDRQALDDDYRPVRLLAEPGLTLDALVEGFLASPLYSRWIGSPTVYTAVYLPIERRVDYLWPGKNLCQHIDRFEPGEYVHNFGNLLL
jgi:predicted choloylglycine hydrolase